MAIITVNPVSQRGQKRDSINTLLHIDFENPDIFNSQLANLLYGARVGYGETYSILRLT